MQFLTKTLAGGLIGLGAFFTAQTAAASYQPDYCPRVHDHRAHDATYYDYYPQDDFYRAGPYRASRSNYSRSRRYDSGYRDRGRRGYRPRSEVVYRRRFPTRFDAYITVVEEKYWTRSGRVQLVCSVLARGPEAYYVPKRRLRRLANRNCSRRARIQYL